MNINFFCLESQLSGGGGRPVWDKIPPQWKCCLMAPLMIMIWCWGSGVVHLLAGGCSLIGCCFMGPRMGRFVRRFDFINIFFGKILFRKFYFMGPRMGRFVGKCYIINILFWQLYFMGPIKGLSGFVTLLLHCHFTGSKTENRSTSRATRCLLLDLEDSSLSLDSSHSMEDPR